MSGVKIKSIKREKKKKPKMPVSGKSVFKIQEILVKKADEIKNPSEMVASRISRGKKKKK